MTQNQRPEHRTREKRPPAARTNTERICAVVLAAGEGQRLRPLTASLPKALCPVGNVALLDRALARLAGLALTGPDQVAVNAAYLADQVVRHVGRRAHLSVEPDGPLGTSGGIGRLRNWIDGRGVLIGNADAYLAATAGHMPAHASHEQDHARPLEAPRRQPGPARHKPDQAHHEPNPARHEPNQAHHEPNSAHHEPNQTHQPEASRRQPEPAPREPEQARLQPGEDIAALFDGWSGETVRMLTKPVPDGQTGGFSGQRFAGFSLLPWRYVRDLAATPSDLVRTVWRPAEAAGELELIGFDGVYIDTGTPADYLRANLHAADGQTLIDPSAMISGTVTESVVGPRARVRGAVTRCVVWPGAEVGADETLVGAIRAGDGLTVQI